MKNKIKLWDIVVSTHQCANIGQVVGVNEINRLPDNKLKPKKYAYHVRFGGASEGFYEDGRSIRKLNEWQAERIKKVLIF